MIRRIPYALRSCSLYSTSARVSETSDPMDWEFEPHPKLSVAQESKKKDFYNKFYMLILEKAKKNQISEGIAHTLWETASKNDVIIDEGESRIGEQYVSPHFSEGHLDLRNK